MKYLRAGTSFSTVSDEISIAIEVTQCPHRCKSCHSPELCGNTGKEINEETLNKLMNKFTGLDDKPLFTCVAFMGGDHEPCKLIQMLKHIKHMFPSMKTCLYTGSDDVSENIKLHLDYLKTGKYDEELGPLGSPNTNQKFFTFERISNER